MTPALVRVSDVAAWLQADSTKAFPATAIPLLTRLVELASAFVPRYLSRPVAPVAATELYDGRGRPRLALRRTPVVSVTSLVVGNTTIPARPAWGQYGYVVIDSMILAIECGEFCWGLQNVSVTYTAGYQTSDAVTVPTGGQLPVVNLSETWNADAGVAYAGGAALTLVTTAPATGQYQVTTDQAGDPSYVFAAGDAGRSVVVTYGYTPADLAGAIIELVGERFKSRNRIGETSVAIGGPGSSQTTSFSTRDMNAFVKGIFDQHRQTMVPS